MTELKKEYSECLFALERYYQDIDHFKHYIDCARRWKTDCNELFRAQDELRTFREIGKDKYEDYLIEKVQKCREREEHPQKVIRESEQRIEELRKAIPPLEKKRDEMLKEHPELESFNPWRTDK